MPLFSRALVFLVVAATVSGCASIQVEPGRRLDPVGFYSVTVVTVRHWSRNSARADIYAHVSGGDSLYIGSTSRFLGRYRLSISPDGRAIVFDHSEFAAPRGSTLRSGVYRHTIGGKRELLRTGSSGFTYSAIGVQPRSVPEDVLPLEADFRRTDTSWAVTTEGKVFPLILLNADSLHWGAFEGRTADCAAMVRNGADVNAQNYWGYTPLDLAIIGDHEETAERLLELGAVAAPGSEAWNRAADLGRTRVVEAMLKRGLAIDATDGTGNTMLHRAAAAAVASTGVQGFFTGIATAESRLVRGTNTRLLQLLLDRGADPDRRNGTGMSPLDLITALIDTASVTRPPRWTLGASSDKATREWTDSLARRRTTLNASLVELQSILKARMKGPVGGTWSAVDLRHAIGTVPRAGYALRGQRHVERGHLPGT